VYQERNSLRPKTLADITCNQLARRTRHSQKIFSSLFSRVGLRCRSVNSRLVQPRVMMPAPFLEYQYHSDRDTTTLASQNAKIRPRMQKILGPLS